MNTFPSGTRGVILILLLTTFIWLCFSCHDSPHYETRIPPASPQTHTGSYKKSSGGLDRNLGHLILTKHAKCRMDCRHITEGEIKEILHDGNINYQKSELEAARGPKYAVEGYSHEHQHLRVIFAPQKSVMIVVTCIDLDTEWQCPSCN